MKNNQSTLQTEKDTIAAMIGIYCKDLHDHPDTLCSDCQQLLTYAHARLDKCPFAAAKPKCSHCRVHCYQPEQQERIKDIMRYSGPRMILKHPILTIAHVVRGRAQ